MHWRKSKERGVLGVLVLLGCGTETLPPPVLASYVSPEMDTERERAGETIVAASATYRTCVQDGHDAEGGFCDVTTRWASDTAVEVMGGMSTVRGGLTAADFDGDGHVDLLVTPATHTAPTLLLRRGDRWTDAAREWGLGNYRSTLASAAADLDGDGDQDLVLAFQNGGPVRLLRNDRTRFVEVAALGEGGEITAVLPADVDRDGRLDLLVATHTRNGNCANSIVNGCPAGLTAYRQTDAWHFEAARVDAAPRRAQALLMSDWDCDGREDLLVLTDTGEIDGGNQVLRIDLTPGGGFSLTDATAGTGLDGGGFFMGAAAIDVDGDGRDEILATNFGRNALFACRGGRAVDLAVELGADSYGMLVPGVAPRFRHFDASNAREAPLGRFQSRYLSPDAAAMPTTKWTPVVFDADDDGFADVFIPAGAIGLADIYPEASAQQSALLRGTGRRLVDVTVATHASRRQDENAAVAADFDEDGDLDLAVFHMARPDLPGGLTVLRNDMSRGRSLTVLARGRSAARDGIGALVEVRYGGRRAHRRLDGNLSIFGSGPHAAHFGLGAATVVDEVTVRFPSGAVVRREHVPAGQILIEE